MFLNAVVFLDKNGLANYISNSAYMTEILLGKGVK
jgi:hypothetical protein